MKPGSLVLLVEDHPFDRMVLQQMLARVGVVVDVAEDGQQALDMFRGGRYGLVLTGLHTPKLSGLELAVEMRAHERARGTGRIPIIALTANVQGQETERCLAAGVDELLSKPVTVGQLGEKLRQWLPQPTPSPVAPPVARAVLDQLSFGDFGKAQELLRSYCEVTVKDLEELDAAQRQGNAGVAKVAHRIKGAALMLGAREVAEIAARIERIARNSPAADVASLAGDLRQAFARVRAYKQEFSSTTPSRGPQPTR